MQKRSLRSNEPLTRSNISASGMRQLSTIRCCISSRFSGLVRNTWSFKKPHKKKSSGVKSGPGRPRNRTKSAYPTIWKNQVQILSDQACIVCSCTILLKIHICPGYVLSGSRCFHSWYYVVMQQENVLRAVKVTFYEKWTDDLVTQNTSPYVQFLRPLDVCLTIFIRVLPTPVSTVVSINVTGQMESGLVGKAHGFQKVRVSYFSIHQFVKVRTLSVITFRQLLRQFHPVWVKLVTMQNSPN